MFNDSNRKLYKKCTCLDRFLITYVIHAGIKVFCDKVNLVDIIISRALQNRRLFEWIMMDEYPNICLLALIESLDVLLLQMGH